MTTEQPSSPRKQKSLTQRTLSGLVWQFFGTGSEAIIKIGVMIVLARLLTPEAFGLAGAVNVVLAFKAFSQLGIGPAVVQRPELRDAHIRSGFAFSVFLGLVFGGLVVAGSGVIADFFRMPDLQTIVAVAALYFPIAGVSIVSEALLARDLRFKTLATADMISFVIGYGVTGVVLALLGWGVWSLLVAELAQVALRSTILVFARRPLVALAPRAQELKELLAYGSGQSLAGLASFTALQVDKFVVGRWMGAEALGLYGRAYQFLTLPSTMFGSVVDRVLFPSMASVQHDRERLERAFMRAIAIVAMVTLPVSAMMIILAPELIYLLLGPKWAAMVPPFQFLAGTLLFRTSYKMSDSLARATGHVYRRAMRQWVYAGAVFLGALIGTRWGLVGVSVGVGLAITLNFFLMLQLSVATTGARWTQLFTVHLRYLMALVPLVAPTVGVVALCRNADLAAIVTIVLGSGVAGLAGLAIFFFTPLYGPEGAWLRGIVKDQAQGVLLRLTRSKTRAPTA